MRRHKNPPNVLCLIKLNICFFGVTLCEWMNYYMYAYRWIYMYIYIVHINIFSFTPLTVPTSPDTRNMCKYIQLIPFEILKLPQRSIQTTESFDTCSLTCWYRIQNWKISILCIFQKGIFSLFVFFGIFYVWFLLLLFLVVVV